MRLLLFIASMAGILILLVAISFFISNTPDFIKNSIEGAAIILTLIILLWYAFETRNIAKAAQLQAQQAQEHTKYTQSQLEFLERPNLFIRLGQLSPFDIEKIPNDVDIRTEIDTINNSKFNIEAKMSVVFKHGDIAIRRHTIPYYSGKIIWNISSGQHGNTHFSLNGFLEDIGFDPKLFLQKLKDKQLDSRLEIAIFSKIRKYKSDECFSENITQFYYLDSRKKIIEYGGGGGQYPIQSLILAPVWVWAPKAPPKEMEEIAFDD